MKGNGDEYQLAKEITNSGLPLVIPINFPAAPDVEDVYESVLVPYEDLKHWELAPTNPSVLEKEGVEIAFTADGLKDKKQFRKNILKAVKHGLTKETALKALTKTPANLLGVLDKIGTLEVGKIANFLITSGDYFEADCTVFENWVQGEKYVLKEKDQSELAGKYSLVFNNGKKYSTEISGKSGIFSLTLNSGNKNEIKGKIKVSENLVAISFSEKGKWTRLSGWVNERKFTGTGILSGNEKITWSMNQEGKVKENSKAKLKDEKVIEIGQVIYPFVAYGNEVQPKFQNIIIKNATVWTLENEGVLENSDVLIKDGKVAQIGQGLNAEDATEIDGTGMHLSPGIIDEHSHIGLNGTNEATHAVTSEVRMRDVLNPEDVSFYRQLSGGVTCAQLLHGSANPIGGQSVIVKFRWGTSGEKMVVKNQVGFLKHALGENVKQSRLPAGIANRFPQSRMGVEQSIRDAYLRAVEYKEKLDAGKRVRKDLQLDAIVDVLNKKSFMGIHAYVQSETNMIIKLAQEFGVKPHTLIHNTEGYKVADQMKESGAAGSLFADWWGFKYEVYDAIPYNAAILTKHDVLSCIHSDNAELARRLNQEAAKAVKYGGLSEVEALKLVTLNPAKILHLDDRMGSIKVGKDADLVLWTDNPLSIYAKAAKTFVDGIVYYDMEKDKEKFLEIEKERSRIIDKILAGGGAAKTGTEEKKPAVRVNEQFVYGDDDYSEYTKE
jgi:imidazolonepropionase-like amidohydrolase